MNTSEGFWTGLRNFLRPFRGVNKVYLQHYLAMHEWAHNIKIMHTFRVLENFMWRHTIRFMSQNIKPAIFFNYGI